MTRNNAMMFRPFYSQRGFSLTETLVAALLLTLSLLGLLQYHQLLQQSFLHQWQQRQAWRLVAQQLDAYEAGVAYTGILNDGMASDDKIHDKTMLDPTTGIGRKWQSGLSEQRLTAECRKVTATVTTPTNYQARLTRWFCQAAQSISG
ncbi:hypothetical protein BHG07_05860 [Brenneria salicis ATCC 15712 = DSM 30166]|nr:hypothetical protein BHG07_05860 [Brenneria salicis ATCC 15712 = DSM 30166]